MKRYQLSKLYILEKKSVREIAKLLHCSENKINYWLAKFGIPKRSIADAAYLKWNPNGDPFSPASIKNSQDAFLYGLGLGLYWGEGNKSNRVSVRIGSTDPMLIKSFLGFLRTVYKIDTQRVRFGLQIFSEMSPKKALTFWCKHLNVSPGQFYKKLVVTPTRAQETYRKKIQHGVVTLYFNNKKLRDTICRTIQNIDGVLLELKPR